MRVDLLSPETWEDFGESLKVQLALPERLSVKAYRGLAHAVFEICEGASNFFSHKRSMGLIKGQTPAFAQLLPGFYKDGYQVQIHGGWPKGTEKTWVESLKKDTNFVLFSNDNPVTGEIFPWHELDAALNERKIFSIRVSHSESLRNLKNKKFDVLPYSAQIISIHPGLALGIVGEKVKSLSVIAAQMPWPAQQLQKQIDEALIHFHEDEEAVKQFEKKLPPGWTALMSTQDRLFDRVLIHNENIHGEAIIEELAKLSQHPIHPLGETGFYETTNLGRWHSTLNFFDWWDHQLSPEVLRGMIIVDSRLLKNPAQFVAHLLQAEKNLAI